MRTRKKMSIWKTEERAAWLFVLLPILQLVVFLIVPLFMSLYMSFTNWNVITDPKLIGLANYQSVFEDTFFRKAVVNTLVLMLGIPISIFLSLLVAVVLNRGMKGSRLFQVLFYVPCICSGVAISILWQWILNKDYGLLNDFLWWAFKIQGPGWLSDPAWVKPSFILMGIWSLGTNILLYLAALKNVPKEYYEAAELDGANAMDKFFKITCPMVTPVTFYIIVMGVINGLQAFGQTYIMTPDGGPGYSSGTIVFYIWQKAFGQYKMGYASAVAWMLGIFILILTIVQFGLQRYWVSSAE